MSVESQIVTNAGRPVGAGSPGENGASEPGWKASLKNAIRDPETLLRELQLPLTLAPAARKAAETFPLFVTREFLSRIIPGDLGDPLLRQVLPLDAETSSPPGWSTDAVGDLAASPAPGLIRKYGSRALLIATGACAIHCRYCFRRHFPYSEGPKSVDEWSPAIRAIEADPAIDEAILSGGDPLTLVDERLAELVERLAAIPHLKRLRIHTRLPIVVPRRVDDKLLGWLKGTRLVPWMVVHANHAQEIDEPTAAALGRLVDAGVPTLNQAVLLKRVNDSVPALVDLCRRLVDLRVTPYYIHQLDRVAGAAHFEVPLARGMLLVEELKRHLPGYAVPRFVRESEGAPAKTTLV